MPLASEQESDATVLQVSALLPWYVNGSLSGSERQLVESHLLQSSLLRQKLQIWQCVAQAMGTEPEDSATEQALWCRLQADLNANSTHESLADSPCDFADGALKVGKVPTLFAAAIFIASLIYFFT